MGAQIGRLAKVGKVTVVGHLIQNITMNAIKSKHLEKVFEPKQTIHRFDAIEPEVFCKNRFASQAPRFGLHSGCALVLTDEWGMNDDKHAIVMKQLRDTL